jgi:hypothetical protein
MGFLVKKDESKESLGFSKNEIEFLLRHLSITHFEGKDVLLLSSIVQKLQDGLK